MQAVLISTYDMGRQPFGLASPAAWLRADGWQVTVVDVAKEKLDDAVLLSADLIGFHLPMHTATRLAAPIIAKARRLSPLARICAYGLYAPLNAEWLRSIGIDAVFGGEFEEELTTWAALKGCATAVAGLKACATETTATVVTQPVRASRSGGLPRIQFLVPDRSGMPPLSRYATLQLPDGTRRLVGYTEASRGCKHLCRHCPIVPVYEGQFRVVQPEVVLADIDAQVASGARHITFGDPDFFNGPGHAMALVEDFHAEHPGLTYDVTIKIEHLLAHRDLLAGLKRTGCLFVTSAVESIDDAVLEKLSKGHTRGDFIEVVRIMRETGLTLSPTFITFTPWTTWEGYRELLKLLVDLDLVDNVGPIQLTMRLLIPAGSLLLELDDIREIVGPFDPAALSYRWTHSDPLLDRLCADVQKMIQRKERQKATRAEIFAKIWSMAHAGSAPPDFHLTSRAAIPYLNEPWYC